MTKININIIFIILIKKENNLLFIITKNKFLFKYTYLKLIQKNNIFYFLISLIAYLIFLLIFGSSHLNFEKSSLLLSSKVEISSCLLI